MGICFAKQYASYNALCINSESLLRVVNCPIISVILNSPARLLIAKQNI